MNLHEEFLLNYLQNPDELSFSTDVLKINNFILEKHFILNKFLAKNLSMDYTRGQIRTV